MVAGEAVVARVAGDVMVDGHAVADLVFRNAFADADDFARDFVPQNDRGLLDAVPFEDVRAADAGGENLDEDFAGADPRDRPLFDPYVAVIIVNRDTLGFGDVGHGL
jgi:hypothetical protein